MFQQSFYDNSDPKNITNPCLPRVALIPELFTVGRDNVDIGRICGGRERESEKTIPRRITKIVHCIRIVFGLPYNYKQDLLLKVI